MGKISTFLLGGVIGAGVALAFAPGTGEENRALVVEKANAFAGEAKDFGAGLPGTAQDVYKSARDKGESLLKDAQDKTGNLVGDASTKVKEVGSSDADQDELRAKIEAARQRIAAQVIENAEQDKDLGVAVAEAAPEPVEAAEAAEETEDAKHAK